MRAWCSSTWWWAMGAHHYTAVTSMSFITSHCEKMMSAKSWVTEGVEVDGRGSGLPPGVVMTTVTHSARRLVSTPRFTSCQGSRSRSSGCCCWCWTERRDGRDGSQEVEGCRYSLITVRTALQAHRDSNWSLCTSELCCLLFFFHSFIAVQLLAKTKKNLKS